MKLLIVCHYHDELSKIFFKDLIDSWDFTSKNVEFSFLLVSVIGKDFPQCNNKCHTLSLQDTDEKIYHRRVEKTYVKTAEYIKNNIDCDMWFWYETDVEIISNKFWDEVSALWNNRRQIMGFWVRDNHDCSNKIVKDTFNGVAFYSKEYIDYLRPYIKKGQDFDRWVKFKDASIDKDSIAVPLNGMYACMHHISRTANISEIEKKAMIIHHVVLHRKNKNKTKWKPIKL